MQQDRAYSATSLCPTPSIKENVCIVIHSWATTYKMGDVYIVTSRSTISCLVANVSIAREKIILLQTGHVHTVMKVKTTTS